MKKPTLPSIPRIKKALYADWSLRVRTRDGFKCLLCGATDNLTAHHWYAADHFAHTARYAIANGATLCYACHIRGIHPRADYVSIIELANVMFVENHISQADMLGMEVLINTELTTALYRELWDAMRKRHIILKPWEVVRKNGKAFAFDNGNQKAVVDNVVFVSGNAPAKYEDCLYLVTTVSKTPSGAYRYTLKRLEEEA